MTDELPRYTVLELRDFIPEVCVWCNRPVKLLPDRMITCGDPACYTAYVAALATGRRLM